MAAKFVNVTSPPLRPLGLVKCMHPEKKNNVIDVPTDKLEHLKDMQYTYL